MDDLITILSSIIVIVGLLFIVCLGWDIPFSFGKTIGIWAGITLISIVKKIIFS